MKKKVLALLPLFVAACSTDVIENAGDARISKTDTENVQSNHYITFKNKDALKTFLENKNNSQTRATVIENELIEIPEQFKPVNAIMAVYKNESPDIVDTEMSIDEFNVMKAENLLLDSTLYDMMDTTLMVKVEDRIYKITEYGTFSALTESALKNAIKDFDTNLIKETENGDVYDLGNNVEYINSFGKIKTLDDCDNDTDDLIEGSDDIEDYESNTVTRASNTYSIPEFHKSYDCKSWKWKNNSVWQKMWDGIRGKDVTKENNFDNKHRVQFEMFEVNYGFYTSTGVKVKMQKRKKYLFINKWISCSAEKIAIGFNKVTGTMKLSNPIEYGTLTPTANARWSECTAAINGVIADFVYASFPDIPFLKDWSKKVYAFIPKVTLSGNKFPDYTLINKMYNAPSNAVVGFLKSQTNKYIFDPTKKKIQERDPRLAYLMWGTNGIIYKDVHPYFMGVVEYDRDSKNVYFNRACGFTINGSGSIHGFLPSKFSIDDIDAFGAAKYKGQWKGVRMYK